MPFPCRGSHAPNQYASIHAKVAARFKTYFSDDEDQSRMLLVAIVGAAVAMVVFTMIFWVATQAPLWYLQATASCERPLFLEEAEQIQCVHDEFELRLPDSFIRGSELTWDDAVLN